LEGGGGINHREGVYVLRYNCAQGNGVSQIPVFQEGFIFGVCRLDQRINNSPVHIDPGAVYLRRLLFVDIGQRGPFTLRFIEPGGGKTDTEKIRLGSNRYRFGYPGIFGKRRIFAGDNLVEFTQRLIADIGGGLEKEGYRGYGGCFSVYLAGTLANRRYKTAGRVIFIFI
jgi:hypothetical protein